MRAPICMGRPIRGGRALGMTGRIWGAAGAVALCMAATPGHAGVFADGLARCVVTAAAPDDRVVIMQWLFAAMAANPQIAPMAKVTPAELESLSRQFMAISERLLAEDCRAEAVSALRNEGPGVIEAVFRVLGEAAMRGLMSDPGTADALRMIEGFTDRQKWAALLAEAGLPAPPAP